MTTTVLQTAFVAATITLVRPPVDIPLTGHAESLSWRAVAGASGASVTSASVVVRPVTAGPGRPLGVAAPGRNRVSEIVVTSPVPGALVRGVGLPGLKRHEGDAAIAVDSSGGLGGDLHLVLTPIIGGQHRAPVIAVPPLPRKQALPPQLVGGSLSGSVLLLPDLALSTFSITVVRGNAPQDFTEQQISYGDVTLYAAPMPIGLHVDGPDGAELYAIAGPLGSTEVDLTAALNRHLGTAVPLASSDAVTSTITLRSDVLGQASVELAIVGGVITRALAGRLAVELTGAPTAIAVPPPAPGRPPRRSLADVTITHHGLALHPLSSPSPRADAGLGGPAVRDAPVVRKLPPEALRGQRLARVAVIGWPLGATDLTLSVLGASASVAGLLPAASRADPSVVWFALGEPVDVDRPVEVALTATRGAFSWIADPDPLVQLAILTAPEGERVTVGGLLVELTGLETVVAGMELTGTDGWPVATDQFCTVSLANVVLEFAP